MFFDPPLIGIDIGSSSVKVCELDRSTSKLKRIGVDLFRSTVLSDGEIKDPDTVAKVIRGVFKKMGLKTRGRRVSIGISGTGVLIKRSLITQDPGTDLIELAAQEASQTFPYEMEELYTRFTTLGKPYPDGRVPMALVGAKREVVEQYIALVHALDLKVGVIDCNALALANMFDFNYPVAGAMIVVVNVGASSSQVLIIYNGEFLYTREISMGGRDYNQKIMDATGVDFDNAENLKISASLGESSLTEDLARAIDAVNEMLSLEIQTTLNFFFENEDFPEGMERLGHIFLCGGSARVLGLDASLAANIQMPVQIANPFQRINIKKSPYESSYLIHQGALYGACLGLALRRFRDE